MAQLSLLDEWLASARVCAPDAPAAPVPGVRLIADYLDADLEAACVAEIDGHAWSTDWKRRVQVYGLGYDDGDSAGAPAAATRPLPPVMAALAEHVHRDGLIERLPENAVVNEYVPGIGIGLHRDYAPFGPTIVGISLLSWCVMDLADPDGARVALTLPPRSCYVIGGEARTRWKHGIAARKSDVIAGIRVPRARRLSITFRTAATTT